MRPLRPRRSILLTAPVLALALAVVAVGCSGGSEAVVPTTTTLPPTTTTLPPSTTTTVTPDPARKVLLLGDSTMVDASPAIIAMFQATGAKVANGAGPGFGLTRLGTTDRTPTWDVDYPRVLREEDPDLVVAMMGIWDQAYIEQNGILAYTRVVEQAADILVSTGAKVVFLSVPPGGENPDRLQNLAFETVAAQHPGQVFFVEYEGVLRGPDGGYPMTTTAPDGSTLHLRKADGFHFCPDGAQRLAEELDRLAVVHGLTVPAAPGWQSGSWRTSKYYQEAACFV